MTDKEALQLGGFDFDTAKDATIALVSTAGLLLTLVAAFISNKASLAQRGWVAYSTIMLLSALFVGSFALILVTSGKRRGLFALLFTIQFTFFIVALGFIAAAILTAIV